MLREERQEFKDGRVRTRDLDASIAEKMTQGESSDDAARRSVEEELGIMGDLFLSEIESRQYVRPSNSFPGLISEYNAFFYEVVLDESHFKSEGYVEEQGDKTTYFIWEKVE